MNVHTTPPKAATFGDSPLNQAGQDVAQNLPGRYPSEYTGVITCIYTNTLTVFRLPGNPALDHDLQNMADKYHVVIATADTKFSRETLVAAQEYVNEKVGELKQAGSAFQGSNIEPQGLVKVDVTGNLDRARRILARVADRVVIVLTPKGLVADNPAGPG
jgi:hypothetical protein